jgi:hypothetical protein
MNPTLKNLPLTIYTEAINITASNDTILDIILAKGFWHCAFDIDPLKKVIVPLSQFVHTGLLASVEYVLNGHNSHLPDTKLGYSPFSQEVHVVEDPVPAKPGKHS